MLFSIVALTASLAIASPLLPRNGQFCVPEFQGTSVSIETGAFGPRAAWSFDTASPGQGSPVVTGYFRMDQPPEFKVEFTGSREKTQSIRSLKGPQCPRLVVSTSLNLTPEDFSIGSILSQSWRIVCTFCATDASGVSGTVASGCHLEADDTDGSCVESDGITNNQLFLAPCDRNVAAQEWYFSRQG